MLVLERRDGEKIKIGEDVTVTLCRSTSGRASIGIDAPAKVKILRAELIAEDGPRILAECLKIAEEVARHSDRAIHRAAQRIGDRLGQILRPLLLARPEVDPLTLRETAAAIAEDGSTAGQIAAARIRSIEVPDPVID